MFPRARLQANPCDDRWGLYDNPDAARGCPLETAVAGADRSVCAPSLDKRDAATSIPTVPATRETTRAVVMILALRFPLFASLAIVISLDPRSVALVGSGCEPTVNDSITASSLQVGLDSAHAGLVDESPLIVKCADIRRGRPTSVATSHHLDDRWSSEPQRTVSPPPFDQTLLSRSRLRTTPKPGLPKHQTGAGTGDLKRTVQETFMVPSRRLPRLETSGAMQR